MSWNYRILYFREAEDPYFAIHEVYYDEKGDPSGYVSEGAQILGESPSAMLDVFKRMYGALAKPVLYAGDWWPKQVDMSKYVQYQALKEIMESDEKDGLYE